MRLLTCLFLISSVLVSMQSCEQGNDPDRTKVRVGITEFWGEAAAIIAKEQGFFEENGLDVEFKSHLAGRDAMFSLFEGEVDIAHVAETPVVFALMNAPVLEVDNIPPFQIFGDFIFTNTIQKIIARKDHGINSPRDIINKRVGLMKGTSAAFYFDSFLLEHQIPADSVKIVNLSPDEQRKAINTGEIDVVVSWEPHLTIIEREKPDKTTRLHTHLSYSTLWLALTLNDFAAHHPEVLTNYLHALKQAQAYIREHPAETRTLVAECIETPIEIIEFIWSDIVFELSLSERMISLMEEQARWMIRNDLTDSAQYNFLPHIHFDPMQEVHPRGIKLLE